MQLLLESPRAHFVFPEEITVIHMNSGFTCDKMERVVVSVGYACGSCFNLCLIFQAAKANPFLSCIWKRFCSRQHSLGEPREGMESLHVRGIILHQNMMSIYCLPRLSPMCDTLPLSLDISLLRNIEFAGDGCLFEGVRRVSATDTAFKTRVLLHPPPSGAAPAGGLQCSSCLLVRPVTDTPTAAAVPLSSIGETGIRRF